MPASPPASAQARRTVPAAAGIGLRFQHHRAVLDEKPRVPWLEVHPENYMGGGNAVACLDAIRRDYPVSLHGVGLSIGSADGLDARHLARLDELIARIEPALVSEHLSWSAVGGAHFADLLPLPMTEEALAVVCANVDRAQEQLGRRILFENPSTYLRYRHSTIPEWEFIGAVAAQTGCGILCDVNNVFVSARNHGFDAERYLRGLPADRIGEIHLAGHRRRTFDDGREILIDDHGSRVCDDVWTLFATAVALFGRLPTLIEWDTDVPPLAVLLDEASRAEALMAAEVPRADAA